MKASYKGNAVLLKELLSWGANLDLETEVIKLTVYCHYSITLLESVFHITYIAAKRGLTL